MPRLSLAFGPQNCPSRPAPRTLPLSSRVAVGKSLVLTPEIPVAWLQPGQAPMSAPPTRPSPLNMRDEAWHRARMVCVPHSQVCVSFLLPTQTKTQENTKEEEASTSCIHFAARSDSLIRQASCGATLEVTGLITFLVHFHNYRRDQVDPSF